MPTSSSLKRSSIAWSRGFFIGLLLGTGAGNYCRFTPYLVLTVSCWDQNVFLPEGEGIGQRSLVAGDVAGEISVVALRRHLEQSSLCVSVRGSIGYPTVFWTFNNRQSSRAELSQRAHLNLQPVCTLSICEKHLLDSRRKEQLVEKIFCGT